MNGSLLLVLLFAMIVTPGLSVGATAGDFAGRWVNVELEPPVFTLYIGTDGEVFNLMPMPQFGAVYKAQEGIVVVTTTVGPLGPPKGEAAISRFTIKNDQLIDKNGTPLLFRFEESSSGRGDISGTWRFFPREDAVEFWTFRSDNQLIYEAGFAGKASVTGDILRLNTKEYKLRRVEETLYLENDRRTLELIKLPWGCFGNVKFDGESSECQ